MRKSSTESLESCRRNAPTEHTADLMSLQLAMATLGTTFVGAALALSGGKAEDKSQPPINAKSKDEESFVKYALRNNATRHDNSTLTIRREFVKKAAGKEEKH
jgi:F-type H+-transporting ATPase subunit k